MCFAMSVATTRYMIQDEMRIQTTKCVPVPVCVLSTCAAYTALLCSGSAVWSCVTAVPAYEEAEGC